MGIALLSQYLAQRGVKYDMVKHPHTVTASECQDSRISLNRLAKAVVLKGEDGFMLAVLPASGHIQFDQLRKQLGADVDMANEEQIKRSLSIASREPCLRSGPHTGLRSLSTTAWRTSPRFILRVAIMPVWSMSAAAFRELMADARHAKFAESP
jgi:Ala-tRNA(Pro) deacylase